MECRFRILVAMAMLMMTSQLTHAQPGSFQIEAGLSYPLTDRTKLSSSSVIIHDIDSYNDNFYSGLATYILPSFDLTFVYNFKNTRLGLGFDNSCNYAFRKQNGEQKDKELIVHILPYIRYYYVRVHDLSIYSAAGYGARFRNYEKVKGGTEEPRWYFSGSWQVIPFGMQVGKRWFFAFDAALGEAWAPMRLSVGYRF